MNGLQYNANISMEPGLKGEESSYSSADVKPAFVLMKKRCMVDLSQITRPLLKISSEYFNSMCMEEVPVQTVGAVETVVDGGHKVRPALLFDGSDTETSETSPQSKHNSIYGKTSEAARESRPQGKGRRTVGKEKAKYTCQVCLKKFTQLGNLCIHQRIHSGDRPFRCTFCPKSFTQLCNMWKHVRTHTGEKPYPCTLCGRAFSQQANMVKHMRVHTGERPYPCGHCPKSFTQRANLLKHELVHTGERPFACRYCSKGFSQLSNLDKHQRVHTGVKPYSCATCGRSFTQQGNLTKHEAVHCDSKPFSCPHCSKSYTQKYNLEKHMQRCSSLLSKQNFTSG